MSQWVSEWVSEWVTDKGSQWSDSGPIKTENTASRKQTHFHMFAQNGTFYCKHSLTWDLTWEETCFSVSPFRGLLACRPQSNFNTVQTTVLLNRFGVKSSTASSKILVFPRRMWNGDWPPMSGWVWCMRYEASWGGLLDNEPIQSRPSWSSRGTT